MLRRSWLLPLLLGLWAVLPAAVSVPTLPSTSAAEDECLVSMEQGSGRAGAALSVRSSTSTHRRIGKRGRPRFALTTRAESISTAPALRPGDVSATDEARSSIPLRLRIHRFNE